MSKTNFQNLKEGLQILNQNWKYIYVNNAVINQSKYSRKELLSKSMIELYTDIEETDLFKTLKHCMEEKIFANFLNKFEFPDGSVGWFELRIQPVDEGLLILSVDVTDKNENELEKKHFIDKLELMLETTRNNVKRPLAGLSDLPFLPIYASLDRNEIQNVVSHLKISSISLKDFTIELNRFITHSLLAQNI